MEDTDPRAKWRNLPAPVRPEEMVAEVDTTTHDSSTAADEDAAQREARWFLERGGGLGI